MSVLNESPSASMRVTSISCYGRGRAGSSRSASWSTAKRPGTAHGLDVDEEGRGTLVQPNWDEVLLTYIFRWGVQTRCWEDD
jgi:hypothetical protein